MGASDLSRASDPRFLQGLWRLNGNVKDYSGHGNHGTWNAAELYTPSPCGRSAADLDGAAGTRITVPDSTSLRRSGTLTYAAWVRPDVIAAATLIAKRDAGGIEYQTNIGADAKFYYYSPDASAVATASTLSAGSWYHLVASVSGTAVAVYINGRLDATGTTTSSPASDDAAITVGAYWNDSGRLNGAMWNARIYSIALTGAEVRALYLAELSGSLL